MSSFQRPSKDPTTWKGWTAHDHVAAAQRLWEMAVLEFTGVHTAKVGGLLQEADVHLTRAKILATEDLLRPPQPVRLAGPWKIPAEPWSGSEVKPGYFDGVKSAREPCTCGAEINYADGYCRNGHFNAWIFRKDARGAKADGPAATETESAT